MSKLFKYLTLLKQKPSIILPAAKGFILANVLAQPALRGAELAVTYRCQASCYKCSTRTLIEEGRTEMSAEEIVSVSRQVVRAGGILIDLTGGEPLLRDDIVTIVEQLQHMPVIVSMATNGYLLNDSLLKSLKKAGLNVIQIGLTSPIAAEHDQELGIAGSFDKVMWAIQQARSLGIEVLINTVITRDILYSDRMEQLATIARENRSYLSLIMPAQVGGWHDNSNIKLDFRDYELIKKWLNEKFTTTDTESCYRRGICPAGTEKVYISAYGDLYPCPFIQQKIGNLLENDFVALWKAMRSHHYGSCVHVKRNEFQKI